MNDEQKFIFDLKGWLVLPGVLDNALIEACNEHLHTVIFNRESLEPHQRNSFSGACQELLDHPAIVDVLREIIAPDVNENAYGFRCDCGFGWRPDGWQPDLPPHNGGPMEPSHTYQFHHGRIFTSAVRIGWELAPVHKGCGGTLFMSGTHKSNYPIPESEKGLDSALFESYECPAGSAVIFSENVRHAGPAVQGNGNPRVMVFNHYMYYPMRFHRMAPPRAAIEAMPPKRRTLFRDNWVLEWPEGRIHENDYYDASNHARDVTE